MRTERTTMLLADLVEDMEIYPRHKVDDMHVASIVRALEAGIQLPPIIADKKSRRVTDGWHRCRAYRRFLGPQVTVDVELRSYPNEQAMLLDAVALNASHGRRFDAVDQTRVVVMLERMGIETGRIALVLHVPETYVTKISGRVAVAPAPSRETITGTDQVALKRPVSHLAGQRLTPEQVKVHGILPGTSFLLVAKQLAAALKADMVNLDDDRLISQFRVLRDELNRILAD